MQLQPATGWWNFVEPSLGVLCVRKGTASFCLTMEPDRVGKGLNKVQD